MTYRPVHQLMPINGAVSFQGRKGHGSVFDVPEQAVCHAGKLPVFTPGWGVVQDVPGKDAPSRL